MVAFLLLLNERDCTLTRVSWVFAGIALSIGVLGIPQNALLYICYLIAVILISRVSKKRDAQQRPVNETIRLCYSYRALAYVTIGVGISLCVFFVYILDNVTVAQIIQTIPRILTDDTAHPTKGLYRLTLAYIVRILIGNHHNYGLFAIYVLLAGVLTVYRCDKKRSQRVSVYIAAATLLSLAMLIEYMVTQDLINYIVFVPNVLAIMIFIMYRSKAADTMLALFIVPGIILTYAEYVASNTGAAIIASASCVACVGSVVVIADAAKRIRTDNAASDIRGCVRHVAQFMCIFLIIEIISLGYYRFTAVFGEDEKGLDRLTYTIETGPSKGLIVTEEEASEYMKLYEDTAVIRQTSDDTKVVYDADPFLWLAGNQRCASYTPHYQRVSSLEAYYEIHPDKIADIIYIQYRSGEETESKVHELESKYGYSVEEVTTGWILTR